MSNNADAQHASDPRNLDDVDVWALVDRNHQPVEEWQPNEPPKVVCHMCGDVYPCQTRKDLREAQRAQKLRESASAWLQLATPYPMSYPPASRPRRRRWPFR